MKAHTKRSIYDDLRTDLKQLKEERVYISELYEQYRYPICEDILDILEEKIKKRNRQIGKLYGQARVGITEFI